MKLLEVKNLCKIFDDKEILIDINFSIPNGKIMTGQVIHNNGGQVMG